MPMLHRAFLLDYTGFQRHVAPIVRALDRGDYSPLHTQAEKIINSMQPEEWLLHNQGTMLERIYPSDDVDSSDIGYWLLIVLSSFLQPAPSITYWGLLWEALRIVGWSENDAWLLIRGVSTASLLKPESDVAQGGLLKTSDPYWHWMIPTQSNQRGWLSLGQIRRLKHQLVSVQDAIMSLDRTTINTADAVNSQGLIDKDDHLRIAYHEALAMLNVAVEAARGLFLVIS